MDVADGLKEMGFAFYGNAGETALEHRADVSVTPIEALCVGGVLRAHEGSEVRERAREQQVGVIAHEAPSHDRCIMLDGELLQSGQVE